MNKYVIMGVIALAAIAAYMYMKLKLNTGAMPITYNPNVVGPNQNAATASTYPFSNVGGAGATQSNQPWSNGSLRPDLSTGLDVNLTNLNMVAQGIKDLSTIASSGSELFGSISSWFSDDSGVAATDNYDYLNWGSDSGDIYA